jgi:diguanylate cyclase (GGDEF)-like protein
LFNLSAQGIFCVSQKPLHGPHEFDVNKSNSFLVVATTDQYDFLYGKNIQDVTAGDASKVAQQALANKGHVLKDNLTALYLTTPSQWQGVVVIEGGLDHSGIDEELLKIFCLNIAIGLENAKFFSHLNRSAYFDSLTELYNRSGLIHFGKKLKAQANNSVSLYIVDIDYFHDIIESLGFEFGNEVLLAMTSMLKRIFVEPKCIARLHSDVFAVLQSDSNWQLKNLIQECSRPFMLSDNSMRLGVTLGEAHCDLKDEEFDIELLLRHAKMALKVAKESKRGMGQER